MIAIKFIAEHTKSIRSILLVPKNLSIQIQFSASPLIIPDLNRQILIHVVLRMEIRQFLSLNKILMKGGLDEKTLSQQIEQEKKLQ